MEWISIKDRLPKSSEEHVLALVKNIIYIGIFRAHESWNMVNGVKTNYEKYISFLPDVFLDVHCDECEHTNNHCVWCSEEEITIDKFMLSFDLKDVTFWMPLPEAPKDKE